jgi:hypothetical protein
MDSRMRALYKIDPQPNGPGQARQIIAEELSSRLPARVLGLLVVEQLADRWGMQHSPQRTEVWCERQRA